MLALLLAANALILLLACVGMMVVFIGGQGYLAGLLLLLLLSLPFSAVCALGGFGWFARRFGWRAGWRAMWRNVPRWQLVALALILALIVCGELALTITLLLAAEAPRFWQHLPLLAGAFAAFAYCAIEAIRVVRAGPAAGAATP